MICQSFIANILGPDFTKLFHHSLTDILDVSNRNTPILICVPTECSSNKREGRLIDILVLVC